MAWQVGGEDRQLTIVRPGVVFGWGENGNFTRLYWGIRGGKFAYPGRKDTIKACIYVKELVKFMLYRVEHHEYGAELYNCCYEPAYTIEHIVEAMKGNWAEAVCSDDSKLDHHACGGGDWCDGRTDGDLPRPCKETSDFYKHLRQETGREWLSVPLDV